MLRFQIDQSCNHQQRICHRTAPLTSWLAKWLSLSFRSIPIIWH